MDLTRPVLFSFDYPPLGGGISRLCSEIVLQSLSHEDIHFEVLSGVERRPWRELSALIRLKKMSSAPFCLCGLWYPEGLIATLVGAKKRIVLAHGSELLPPRQVWRRKIWSKLQDWVLSRADLVVANSHYTAGLVKKVSPLAKVVALPLAVDTERFKPGSSEAAKKRFNLPSDKFIISTVARLYEYKGFETVFKALSTMPQEEKEKITYVIAGTGAEKNKIQKMAESFGVASQVLWLGFVTDQELPLVYQASDVFVLCTRESEKSREVEGFGLVFLEAQSCGIPTIGTRAGGIPDAIQEGQGGWLIAQDDSQELKKIIQMLMKDGSELSRQKEMARQRVLSSCTWKKYVGQLSLELKKKGILND